ncbi:MAG: GTPase Era [Anaerolineaceae bacterium]
MTENKSETPYRSGFVSIIGRPNAGKSTLLNRLMGQPIAGVSAKPQTTRKRQLGILTSKTSQIIFVDTPGLHESKDKLSEFINNEAEFAIHDADVLCFITDGSTPPDAMDEKLTQMIRGVQANMTVLLLVNKSDSVGPKNFEANKAHYEALLPGTRALAISAQTGAGVEYLLDVIGEMLPEGPAYYPEDQITETFERDIVAEMIRAACLTNLEDEVPYSIAVRVNEFSERENDLIYINATVFVEREAQKAIVIGKGGEKIKQIGSTARVDIERMSGQKAFLDLSVKVRKDWKNDQVFLKELGLARAKD